MSAAPDVDPDTPRAAAGAVALAAILVLAVVATFGAVRGHEFLNWDDRDVAAAAATHGGGSLAAWAFTTTEIGHYQPLSWLVLAALTGGPSAPARVHTASLALHAVNVVLLLWLTARLLDRGQAGDQRWLLAAATTALFAVHPLRAEPVAWASALPYLLSYAPLLLAVGCWVTWVRHGSAGALACAVGLYAVSQLARVTAPLLPGVLILLALADPRARKRPIAALAGAVLPFVLVAAPLAWLEAGAREVESLADFGPGPRVSWALVHPAEYVWRTLRPVDLSPLDPLPRVPSPDWGVTGVVALVSAAVVLLTAQAASWRVAAAVWGSYLLLLAPVVGLLPSGLQATADRYMYGPGMVLSIALAAALAAAPDGLRRAALVGAGGAAVLLAQGARTQAAYWHDSVSVWSRTIALDPDNDVALYNLALAEIETGRSDRAIATLQRLVALVPDHALGRARLAALVADREQAAGERAAAAGDLVNAVGAWDRALAADPGRAASRVNRGMALVRLGRTAAAVPDLEAALAAGNEDLAVANALAFAWAAEGRAGEAIMLLRRTLARHADDPTTSANLARLLVTADPPALRDADEALRLASGLNDRTGGQDPRVLDTLALALAATGRSADARRAMDAAIAQARDRGDAAFAAELERRRRALGR
ncbi:MAG: tetratricopeptide repeat protein [Vicinamibacterales bacterium]